MYLQKVNLLFGLGRYAAAEVELRAALAKNPDDALAHAMLGVALSRLGKLPEALEESTNAIGLDPTSAYNFFARSLVLIRARDYQEALRAVREAIGLDANNPEHFLIFAALLFDKRKWGRCLAELDRALAIDPQHVGCLNLRGRALLRLGRREEAEQGIKSALAAAPEDAESHHAQGLLLLSRAQSQEALDYLLEARRLDPVDKNDARSIALAVGRQMPPFRWIGAVLPRYYVWPPKIGWATFNALLFVYVTLNVYFPLPPDNDRFLLVDRRHLPGIVFGGIVANLLLAPFTLDALATLAALLVKPRFVGTTWAKVFRQVVVLTLLCIGHEHATIAGLIPPVIVLVLAVGASGGVVKYVLGSWLDDRLINVVSILYGLPIGILTVTMMALVTYQPRESLVQLAIFAPLTFFSDNVLRWIRRRAP